jgi:hypothetical protein
MLVLLAGLVMVLGPAVGTSWAQLVKGGIAGIVVDSTGAVVPGAEAVALDPATSSTGKSISDSVGAFRIPLLAVGTYNLSVTKEGFRKLSMVGVQVNSAATTDVGTLQLEVGQATTTVEVSANVTVVEATQAQITNTLTNSTITFLPIVGQNEGMDFLAVLLPGVNASRDDNFANTNGVGFSSNGIRGRNNDQQIDGANNNDNSVTGPGLFLSNTDWVQEYQVTTSNFGVEYSRNSGSVINIVTKSGTNDYHGSAFVTENSWKTQALNNAQIAFEGLTKPPISNDEFSGVSVGGPIRKDKIFFFAGFDDEIIPGTSVDSTGNLEPTPTGLATLQACLPSSGTIQALGTYGPYAIKAGNPQPLPGSVVTKTIAGVTCSDGSALGPVQFGGVVRTLSTPYKEYDWLGRMDYQGAKDRIYARFIRQTENYENEDLGTAWAGYPENIPSIGYQAGLDWTRTFSPNLVNDARLNYSRLGVQFGGNDIGNTVPTESNLADGLASVAVPPGYAGFGFANIFPQGRIGNTYQLQDNLSWTHAKHTVKAGTNLTYARSPNVFLPNYNGTYNFVTMANYFEDIPSSIDITLGPPVLDFREHDSFLYVGDDFKATKNLTLNLGLSWAYYGQAGNLFHKLDVANEKGSQPFFDPTLPLSVLTSPLLPPHRGDFGPNAGFAYAPGGGKTVIRGGYRLTYDPAYYNAFLLMSISAPQVLAQTLTGASAAANPMPANPLGPVVRSSLASYLTLGVLDPREFDNTTISPNFGPDHVQGWSFGVERQLSSHAVVESRYVGNHGGGLFQSLNANPYVAGLASSFPSQVPSGVTGCSTANAVVPNAIGRENCNEGVLNEVANTGVSDYNGWQNELRTNNLWNQLTLRTSFTWSKTTDNTSEIFGATNLFGLPGAANTSAYAENPFDTLHGEHALSGLDVPAQWTLSFVEGLPFYRGQHGLRGHVGGGWSLSGSYIISSGQPYTPIQEELNYLSGGTAYDTAFDEAIIGFYETARPFVLTPSAPASSVAVYAGDLCTLDGVFTGGTAGCNLSPNTLLSWNAYNQGQGASPSPIGSARFLVNGAYADSVYNEPWGTAARNSLRDARINQANFQISKDTNVTERVKIRFDAAFLNVFNHPNFASVDPVIEDAGYTDEGFGFATPSLFPGGLFGGGGPGREIKFGLKILF